MVSRAKLADTKATLRWSWTSVQSKSRPASNGVPRVWSNPGEIHLILREGGSSLAFVRFALRDDHEATRRLPSAAHAV